MRTCLVQTDRIKNSQLAPSSSGYWNKNRVDFYLVATKEQITDAMRGDKKVFINESRNLNKSTKRRTTHINIGPIV